MRHLLRFFQHPTHYLGTEKNSVHKDQAHVKLHWGLVFPDLYEVGMSYLGQKILYHLLNQSPTIWAERIFAPSPQVASILRAHQTPLSTLESDTPLTDLDILGFSLTHELCYTTVLYILDLANIPWRAQQRNNLFPLIIAGGGACFNPTPVQPFFDLFVLGDGEEIVLEISQLVIKGKEKGRNKQQIIQSLAKLPGIFTPHLQNEQSKPVVKRTVPDLNQIPFPAQQIVPYAKTVHDRFTLEIARGCTRGCRFCQAGMIYRPVRERNLTQLEQSILQAINCTGFEELSFLSLSTGDFSQLEQLFSKTFALCQDKQISISLSSLRVGSVNAPLLQLISKIRRTGITLAPEAGSQRLRDVINKGITEEELLNHCQTLINLGWTNVKLYFMIGLPTEEKKDLQAILDLCLKIKDLIKGQRFKITASISPFVPKPHTPFQWEAQDSLEETRQKLQFLLKLFQPHKKISLKFHQPEMSFLEGIFSRGDQRLSQVLELAYSKGEILTSWQEHFHFATWMDCFASLRIDPKEFLEPRPLVATLPWEPYSPGINKKFLIQERNKALDRQISLDCRYNNCLGCGVCTKENKLHPRINQSTRDQENKPPSPSQQGQNRPDMEQGKSEQKKIFYRLWHKKIEDAIFFSQLEWQTILQRMLRRCQIALCFSKGFHPLPLLSFGQALPVGVASKCEWVQVALKESLSEGQTFLHNLNEQAPPGIKFYALEQVDKKKCTLPLWEEFDLALPQGSFIPDPEWVEKILQQQEITVLKKGKKGMRTINIRPYIQSIDKRGKQTWRIRFSWQGGYLSPLFLVQQLTGLAPANLWLCKVALSLGDKGV